ncbi:epoxyqueuosine reductase [Desulfatirhabdium butyrativorans]|uniref:epoxyqueuosine reductase n=1 Tax=Desulfatirhabdium butyrativorans TaxID=340467 RepID=UPI0012EBEB2E|nr:epoxyqueuosine reductase [Desulfatirhabdium butyrativorans]
MMDLAPMDTAAWVESEIQRLVCESVQNRLNRHTDEPAFARPLVGFSSGADALYTEYVAHIGEFYLKPLDIFRQAFPEQKGISADELTVISWILPSTSLTRQEHAAQDRYPARRWAETRYFGEQFNEFLRHQVVELLSGAGIPAVAPVLAPFWRKIMDGERYAPCSNWSERHAAFAAGLGTFGLCDGLITAVGKAVRIGSVVARCAIPPTPRPYSDRHAYCLFYAHGTCGRCMGRCPVQAIGPSGHDKKRCMAYTEHAMHAYMKSNFGIETYACGLCQVDVPCMDHIPKPHEA